jgi:putative protease
MIRHIPDLVRAGIGSAKIEGRMKSIYYVATVVRAYRQAIDAYYADPEGYAFREEWLEELEKVSHREFTTGFYYGKAGADTQNYLTSKYIKEYSFVGLVTGYDPATGLAEVEQRNKMVLGDTIEVFGPGMDGFSQTLTELYDGESGAPLEAAPHPQQKLKIRMEHPVRPYCMLREKIAKELR